MTALLPIPDLQSIPAAPENGEAWDVYVDAVTSQLERMAVRGEDGKRLSQLAKRRAVVWGLAWQDVTAGVSKQDVFNQANTCSKQIYSTKWQRQPLFMDVLDKVTDLTRKYTSGEDARRMAHRREIVREMEWKAAVALDKKVQGMLAIPLVRSRAAEDEVTHSDDGRTTIIRKTIIEPARWGFGDAGRIATTASVLGRRSVGMDLKQVIDEAAVVDSDAEAQADLIEALPPDALAAMIENLALQIEEATGVESAAFLEMVGDTN